MTSALATKQDLQHHEKLMASRFDALEERVSLKLQNLELKLQSLESRLVLKLGGMMTILFGLFSGVLTLLRL